MINVKTCNDSLIDTDRKIKILEIATETVIKMMSLDNLKNFNFDNELDKVFYKLLNLISSEKINYKNNLQVFDYESTYCDDYIICLEDGKKLKMLKRHLKTFYNMSFQDYKIKWNLPDNYPNVCKNYSILRKKIATKSNDENL